MKGLIEIDFCPLTVERLHRLIKISWRRLEYYSKVSFDNKSLIDIDFYPLIVEGPSQLTQIPWWQWAEELKNSTSSHEVEGRNRNSCCIVEEGKRHKKSILVSSPKIIKFWHKGSISWNTKTHLLSLNEIAWHCLEKSTFILNRSKIGLRPTFILGLRMELS